MNMRLCLFNVDVYHFSRKVARNVGRLWQQIGVRTTYDHACASIIMIVITKITKDTVY